MKKLIIAAIVLAASTAFAGGTFQTDASQQTKIQGYAEDGTLSTALTALKSTTVNMVNMLAYKLYCAADSKYRLTPTADKGAYPQHTVPGGVPKVGVVNKNSTFLHYSGACEFGGQ